MNCVAYLRCSSESQDHYRQRTNLEAIAKEKGWTIKRVFAEKISGTIKTDDRKEFRSMVAYTKENGIKMILVSSIDRVGRRVLDILSSIDILHQNGIALYVQQFNMTSLEADGRENPMVRMLIQMLAMGAEMENGLRKERQLQGIAIAKLRGKYTGRAAGSRSSKEKLITKYRDVVDLLKSTELPLKRVSEITGRSINTVRKVKMFV